MKKYKIIVLSFVLGFMIAILFLTLKFRQEVNRNSFEFTVNKVDSVKIGNEILYKTLLKSCLTNDTFTYHIERKFEINSKILITKNNKNLSYKLLK